MSGTIYNNSQPWSQCGGIAGYMWQSIIINCGARVDITTISSGETALAGGIVGQNGFSIVANNYVRGSIYADAGINASTIGGVVGMQAGVAGNNYSDMSLTSKNTTTDIGGIAGRNTGMGVINYAYFNSEQTQQPGNTVLDAAKAVGVNVGMFTTGIIKNAVAKTGAELQSEAFRDLLIENYCEELDLRVDLNTGIESYGIRLRDVQVVIDNWILDTDNIVKPEFSPEMSMATPEVVKAPVISTNGGKFTGSVTVTITSGTSDVKHHRRQRADQKQHGIYRQLYPDKLQNGKGDCSQDRHEKQCSCVCVLHQGHIWTRWYR